MMRFLLCRFLIGNINKTAEKEVPRLYQGRGSRGGPNCRSLATNKRQPHDSL